MNFSKLVTISATAALALPAAALAGNGHGKPVDPGSQGKSIGKPAERGSQGKGKRANPGSRGKGRCKKPTVNKGFVASGTYGPAGSFSPTAPNADGTYTGTVSFTVTHTNRHATGATGPFSFVDARVTFNSPTATAPAATDDVKVIGKVTVAKKNCAAVAPTVKIRKVKFSAPELDAADDAADAPEADDTPATDETPDADETTATP